MTILPGRHMSQVEIMFSVLWNESGFTVCINPPCSDHRDTSTFFCNFAVQCCAKRMYTRETVAILNIALANPPDIWSRKHSFSSQYKRTMLLSCCWFWIQNCLSCIQPLIMFLHELNSQDQCLMAAASLRDQRSWSFRLVDFSSVGKNVLDHSDSDCFHHDISNEERR